MFESIQSLLDPSDFPARWNCGNWTIAHGWFHVVSDLSIWLAYLIIPLVMWFFLLRRADFPYRKTIFFFGGFILLCGLTHLMEAILFWWPVYRMAGLLKVSTAIVSWVAVFSLIQMIPTALQVPSPEELERQLSLKSKTECSLLKTNVELESRIRERTQELERVVESLKSEIEHRVHVEEALRQSEAQFRQLADAMPQIAWKVYSDTQVQYFNERWYEYTGLQRDKVGHDDWRSVIHPDDLEHCLDVWRVCVETGQKFELEYRLRHGATGEYRWHLGRAFPIRDPSGRIVHWFGTGTDIHDKKLDEETLKELNATLERHVSERTAALQESEERFRSAFEFAPIGMALVSPEGRWLKVNRSICELVGRTEQELLAIDFQTITHPDDLNTDLDYVRQMLEGKINTYQMEKRYFHKAGHVVYVRLSVSLVRDKAGEPMYFISQIKDVSQQKETERQMVASLQEKEVLLKEIHHRVKNNLQIVCSLLDLQSDHTTDPLTISMFQESRGRVRSMALVHERLYRSPDVARVNFGEYVRGLTDDLFHTYKISEDDFTVEYDVNVPGLLIDVAIPCGLLLNELLTNCFKHAFRDAHRGSIRVSFRRVDEQENVLIVADDGAGFPDDVDFRNTASFGLQLVTMLVQQLQGEVTLQSGPGTTFSIRFPVNRK